MKKRPTKVKIPEDKTFTEQPSKRQLEFQKRYDDECRKLNAASKSRNIEAIRLCGNNIKAIKEEARKEEIIINIASDESFGTDEPHVHITKEGQAIFVCGNVMCPVDIQDLTKAIGVCGESSPLDRLMDSQVVEIARSMGLQVDPFVRELVMVPIRGMVQKVWYRDIEKHTSEHLEKNQTARVDEYHRKLSRWEAAPDRSENGPTRTRRSSGTSRTSMMSKSFEVIKGEHAGIASGRESDLFKAIKGNKSPITFSQIVESAKGHLKTKQDFEAMVSRFLKELIGHGAVKEVK